MNLLRIAEAKLGGARRRDARGTVRVQPVHVFYGGADRFTSETPEKLGRLALDSLDRYAPDFITFAGALWLNGADSLPQDREMSAEIEQLVREDPERAQSAYPGAGFCLEVYRRTRDRLASVPVEDFRIDFEDGYGFRPDEEEDADAARAGAELAKVILAADSNCPAYGFRVKSLNSETRGRSARTLEIFLASLAEGVGSELPQPIRISLPKVETPAEVGAFREMLETAERELGLGAGKLEMEAMIETPSALGCLREIAEAGGKRLTGAHFGAYDYTSLLGIASDRQHLHHESCVYARSRMLNDLADTGIWLSDSVTVKIPVPVHKGEELKDWQVRENARTVHAAWRLHYTNIIRSMASGFYQSWDLHPAQLVARYGAVYSFYLESSDSQISRLRSFIEKASKATLTGNAFDDAASAEGILNFLRRGVSCGALDAEATAERVGMTPEQLREGNFREIAGASS